MKKLTALFLGCIIIAGAFSSCGKDDSSSKKESDPLEGSWLMEDDEDGFDMAMTFSNGVVGVEMDFSGVIHFSGKNAFLNGADFGADGTVFEDGKLTLTLQGTEVLTMTRTEGEGDSLDGKYSEPGGIFLQGLGEDPDLETSVRIDGESFFIVYDNFCKYTIDEDKVILKDPPAIILSGAKKDEAVMTYEIDGDTLSLTDENDTVQTLTRVK